MEVPPKTSQALLDAQLELWHHTFGYIKSMALKTALDLRIPDAIHDHGCAATLSQIVTKVTLHPSKFQCLGRLMRVLTATGICSVQRSHDSGEQVYGLTPASHLLVGNGPSNISPFVNLMLDSIMVSPLHDLSKWFQLQLPHPSPFELTHGQPEWDFFCNNTTFCALFNEGMVADSNFIMDIITKHKQGSGVFQGISSLIDVAGGLGGAAHVISKAFPHVECSVLDLPDVVANAPFGTKVKYIDGDMFECIPPTDAVFLKWVLHDWDDDKCVKILKNCKKAIPSRGEGGKVIIVDIVIGAGQSDLRNSEVQALFDLFVMGINGIERDEQEWKKIFFQAGFSDYKITPVLGVRSIIEVYP